jgi:hypothetical protein
LYIGSFRVQELDKPNSIGVRDLIVETVWSGGNHLPRGYTFPTPDHHDGLAPCIQVGLDFLVFADEQAVEPFGVDERTPPDTRDVEFIDKLLQFGVGHGGFLASE